jgi:hypothetical protein
MPITLNCEIKANWVSRLTNETRAVCYAVETSDKLIIKEMSNKCAAAYQAILQQGW